MNSNKYLALLFIAAFLLGCNSIGIEHCKVDTIEYKDLPSEIKEVVFDSSYVEINQPKKYELLLEKKILMPWIPDTYLKRKKDGKTYRLEFSSPHRSDYFIKDDFLFVPQHYNIYKSDSSSYSFSRFTLK
jgi:hypothetical protein